MGGFKQRKLRRYLRAVLKNVPKNKGKQRTVSFKMVSKCPLLFLAKCHPCHILRKQCSVQTAQGAVCFDHFLSTMDSSNYDFLLRWSSCGTPRLTPAARTTHVAHAQVALGCKKVGAGFRVEACLHSQMVELWGGRVRCFSLAAIQQKAAEASQKREAQESSPSIKEGLPRLAFHTELARTWLHIWLGMAHLDGHSNTHGFVGTLR